MTSTFILRQSVVLILMSSACVRASADDRTADEILPASTLIFVEVRQPQQALTTIYDHELVRRAEGLAPVRAALEKKPFLDFKAGVAVLESQMGLPWRRIFDQAAGHGLFIAFDAKTQGVMILAHAVDETTQRQLIETLAKLAGADAQSKGALDPVKAEAYRGIKAYMVNKLHVAVVADWLIVTNNEELGRQVVDRVLDRSPGSLADDPQFAAAHGGASPSSLWAYVNTATLRDAGLAKKLLGGQAENAVAEALFGGVLSTLQQTPYITAGLDLGDRKVQLFAAAPHDRSWAGESREYFFGPQGSGAAPRSLTGVDTIASLCAYRDISGMWLRAGDLLNEKSNEELAKAESDLSTLFAGKDFGEDILGAFQPELQIVVDRQVFSDDQPAPAIKLPAFGLVAEMKDPDKMQAELRRTFQNLIGFFNVVGAMDGQPQLELDMEKTEAAQFVTATHLPDLNADDPSSLKINYNFSPSIAFSGNRFVLASTSALAHTLATAKASSAPPGEAPQAVNTDAVLHAGALREILTDNRGQLVAQNMLKEGHSKEEAEQEIGVLLELLGWFDNAALSLDTSANELRVSLEVSLK
jgi:hypothetical protein